MKFSNKYLLKFIFLLLMNFFIIFQLGFSYFFFLSSKLDEEFIIMLSIFFVIILILKTINNFISETLIIRFNIYLNCFLLIITLLKKSLKKEKKILRLFDGSRKNIIILLKSNIFSNNVSLSSQFKFYYNFKINLIFNYFSEYLVYFFNLNKLYYCFFFNKNMDIEIKFIKLIELLKLILSKI